MRIKVPLRAMTLIYVKLHAVGTTIQCWSKFHWELSFKNVRFARYRGSKSTMMSSFFRGIFLFFGTYINLYTIAPQFNPEQSILGNHTLKIYGFWYTGAKVNDDVIIFFQVCRFMYHDFYSNQSFLGTAMHCFS